MDVYFVVTDIHSRQVLKPHPHLISEVASELELIGKIII